MTRRFEISSSLIPIVAPHIASIVIVINITEIVLRSVALAEKFYDCHQFLVQNRKHLGRILNKDSIRK